MCLKFYGVTKSAVYSPSTVLKPVVGMCRKVKLSNTDVAVR